MKVNLETLSAENVVLRKFESRDVEQFVEAVRESAESVGSWLPWWNEDYSPDDARSWFQACDDAIVARSGFDIGIFSKDDELFIGGIAINRIDSANRSGALGYWVRDSQQGNGYCSAAVNRIKVFGFKDLALTRLEIVVLTENKASCRVAEKCGAKLECIAENKLMHRGQPAAAAVYSLTS
jgi:ribosomal-protein-serine acetyltransferase